MKKVEVAEVLEEAARLYRDEKVEWCSGSWVEVNDDGGENNEVYELFTDERKYDSEGLPLSACAEGTILRAVGYSWNDVSRFYGGNTGELSPQVTDPTKFHAFKKARAALAAHLRGASGADRIHVPDWNDNLTGTVEEAKAKVIEAMEATAKDLRNAQ
jgi:hypothetical protein